MTRKDRKAPFFSTFDLTVAAVFTALTVILSSFSIPVPGGHLYLCDIAICSAAILLDPFSAFVVGGVGSFLGDFFFYPAPMFVSLVTHGVQAIIISVFSRYILKEHRLASSVIGLITGAVVMVAGYTFGRAFIYATPEYAIIKLPFEVLQALLGVFGGIIICYSFKIRKVFENLKAKRMEKRK